MQKARALRPGFVEATRARCARWRAENGAYWLARCSLRKRGLLTSETAARVATLKGKGEMPTHAALSACGLAALVPTATNARTRRAVITAASERPDAWTLPSPTIAGHLAHAVELRFYDRGIPRTRITDYGGARVLHGALHKALGIGHSRDATPFALVLPTAHGAPLYFVELELSQARGLVDRLPERVLLASDPRPLDLRATRLTRLRAPADRAPGQYRARVIAAGPLALKKSNRVIAKRAKEVERPYLHQLQTNPTDLTGALERVAARIGLQIHPGAVIARVIAHDLEALDPIHVGGHWRIGDRLGCVEALVGVIDVECNAVGRWLLDCAALVGLGSKTAIGFGRVRVEDL